MTGALHNQNSKKLEFFSGGNVLAVPLRFCLNAGAQGQGWGYFFACGTTLECGVGAHAAVFCRHAAHTYEKGRALKQKLSPAAPL